MKLTIYQCDSCHTILSDEHAKISDEHWSLNFGSKSGYAKKNMYREWKISKAISGIKQFCDADCIKEYFLKIEKQQNENVSSPSDI